MIYNNIARLLTHLSDLELENTILNTGTSLKITLNVTPSYLNKKKYKGTIMDHHDHVQEKIYFQEFF